MIRNKKNALFSVSDKEGVVDLAKILAELNWNLFASSGTAKVLREAGLEATDIGDIVGPPILGHRVVTIDRKIAAGVLARDVPADWDELERTKATWFELVYVNFYPLEVEIDREGATMEDVIEKTDIGGPLLLREAAKGRRLVISDTRTREAVRQRLLLGTADDPDFRHILAMKAELRVALYCQASGEYIRNYLNKRMLAHADSSLYKE